MAEPVPLNRSIAAGLHPGPIPETAALGDARRGAILLVEDRDDVRQGLAQLLELHGFVVLDARDGREAFDQLRMHAEHIALVLLDLVLPGPIGGTDLRRRQLADPELAGIPTVVVTASDLNSEAREPLHATAWLDKPFRFDHLLQLVRRYVLPELRPAVE